MNLAAARAAVAAALNTVTGLDVRARPPLPAPVTGDGWVVVTRVVPATFTASLATLTAVICLGTDRTNAETHLDAYAVQVIDAATSSDLGVTDVSVEPVTLIVGQNSTEMNALALSLSLEVETT